MILFDDVTVSSNDSMRRRTMYVLLMMYPHFTLPCRS